MYGGAPNKKQIYLRGKMPKIRNAWDGFKDFASLSLQMHS